MSLSIRLAFCASLAALPACQTSQGDLTVAEVLASPRRFEGKRVTIRGFARALSFSYRIADGKVESHALSVGVCTALACDPAQPCCNHCARDLSLVGSLPDSSTERGIKLVGANIGCSSGQCAYTCTPPENKAYRATGILRVSVVGEEMADGGRKVQTFGIGLEVESIAPEER